jgi:hypothetical protein
MRWGYSPEGQFIGLAAGYALEVLVLSLPAVVLLILRWARTTQTARAGRLTGITPAPAEHPQ